MKSLREFQYLSWMIVRLSYARRVMRSDRVWRLSMALTQVRSAVGRIVRRLRYLDLRNHARNGVSALTISYV
jgi:hypothetical protein